jgi:isochorismate hydrolase
MDRRGGEAGHETVPGAPLCDAALSQLLIVDIQTGLGAAMPSKVINRVLQNTRLLLQTAGLVGVPVKATLQYPNGLGPLEPGIAAHVPTTAGGFEKTAFSCARADGFLAAIAAEGRRQIVVAGMEAHICVLQTAVDLVARGYMVFVAEDGVCSRRLENYQNALMRMHRSGVWVVSAESVVFEWLGDAKHERFKAVAGLLP